MDYIRSHINLIHRLDPACRLVIRALILKITLTSLGHTEHMQLFIMDHGWLPNFDVTLYILNSDSMWTFPPQQVLHVGKIDALTLRSNNQNMMLNWKVAFKPEWHISCWYCRYQSSYHSADILWGIVFC